MDSLSQTTQIRELAIKILNLLSTILTSINDDFTADSNEQKKYIKTARQVSDGVEYVNGNGNVVLKIPVMK